MDTVIVRLDREQLMASFHEAVKAALLIDCIWFKNGKLMPAVIEIEHTTGVVSGLTRMQNLKTHLPFPTRYVIAAPDEDREKVLTECNREQFKDLKAQFFPYSAVDELYSLCQRRKITGVSEAFIDSFMEPTQRIQ
jgi:type II restriction enzyme